jgi:hypothetical protein
MKLASLARPILPDCWSPTLRQSEEEKLRWPGKPESDEDCGYKVLLKTEKTPQVELIIVTNRRGV